ncbi:transcriptional regulator [Actinomadura sp. NBRC 104412]|uniref:helix-turn-helix domain-containing protein n=1 Tax=Actinomadura sp. NBRC 104412 TaxID=3032203 RepID=UPI0024A1E8F5|nr:helix-turn-helix transcriptional regulator [Actinomadura sp. NBRC 104412]GLZ07031.1 transcriptional regulator [Actinomadura sp. NBRC 104412]
MPQPPKQLTPSDGATHLFGSEVRRYRMMMGLSIAQLAEQINYSPSFIGAVERAESGCERGFAVACDQTLETREALAHLWDGLFSRRPGNPVPEWFVEWPIIEDEAEALCVYNPCVVYGLLQTEEYAEIVLFGDRPQVEARLARQAVLTKADAPRLVYLLPEHVLWYDVGGAGVMGPQLDRLCEAVSSRLSVQVVPNGQSHPGNKGEFTVATLPRGAEVGYVATAARGMILDAHKDIATMKDDFSAIRAHALPVGMSIDLIQRTKEERWKT